MTKDINTLIPDVYSLLSKGDKIPELGNLLEFSQATIIKTREMISEKREDEAPSLRLSRVGTPDRKLWYEHNFSKPKKEITDHIRAGEKNLTYLVGHIMEALLICLIKEAGHTVEHAQLTVDVDGVEGHLDCVVDGHLVDIKTASQFAFDKFKSGKLLDGEDPFGYIPQLSAYKKGLELKGVVLKEPCYILALNKSNQDLVLTEVPNRVIIDVESKIRRQKEVITLSEPPKEKCYPETQLDNGNVSINKNCNYCAFKDECFRDANGGIGLRKFKYAKDVVCLTKVVSTPKVEEVTYYG